MLSDLYCLLYLVQCVNVNCKMSQHAQSARNIEKKEASQEINACVGRPFAQRSIDDFFLYFYTFSQLCLGYSLVNHLDV